MPEPDTASLSFSVIPKYLACTHCRFRVHRICTTLSLYAMCNHRGALCCFSLVAKQEYCAKIIFLRQQCEKKFKYVKNELNKYYIIVELAPFFAWFDLSLSFYAAAVSLKFKRLEGAHGRLSICP